jgi:hypothetical protein
VGAAASRAPDVPGDIGCDVVARFDAEGANAAATRIARAFPAPVRLEDILSPRDLADLEGDAAARALESVEDGAASIAVLGDPRIAHSGALRGLALFALHRRLAALARTPDGIDALEHLLRQAAAASLPVSGAILAHELGCTITRTLAESDPADLSPESVGLLVRAVSRARALAPDVNLWRTQEAYIEAVGRLRGIPAPVDLEQLGDALGVRLPADNDD